MQYEFKYISTDNYELVYTNTKKEEVKIPFTRTTKMARDLQRIQVDARMEMYSGLAEKGMTKVLYTPYGTNNDKIKTFFEETNT